MHAVTSVRDINREIVEESFDLTITARGERYQREGRVKTLEMGDKLLFARVLGTRLYETRVEVMNGELRSSCSCPYGEGCKHAAAALYEYLKKGKKAKPLPGGDLQRRLKELRKDELLGLVNRLLEDEPGLKESVEMALLPSLKPGEARHLCRRRLKKIFEEDFFEYADIPDLLTELRKTMREGERFMEASQVSAAADWFAAFVDECMANYESMDDSDGIVGDLIQRSILLYYKCLMKSEEREEERQRVLEEAIKRSLHDDFGLEEAHLDGALEAAKSWGMVGDLKKMVNRILSTRRDVYARDLLEDFLLDILEEEGRDEEVLEILNKRDEKSADYDRLAEILMRLGREDELKRLCEKLLRTDVLIGRECMDKLEAFMDERGDVWSASRLRLMRSESNGWSSRLYQEMKVKASQIWKGFRKEAIAYLRKSWMADDLAPLYLEEGMIDEALLAASEASPHARVKLARRLKKRMPEIAADLYEAAIPMVIETRKRDIYVHAATWLEELQGVLKKAGEEERWNTFYRRILEDTRRLRSFREELQRRGLLKNAQQQ